MTKSGLSNDLFLSLELSCEEGHKENGNQKIILISHWRTVGAMVNTIHTASCTTPLQARGQSWCNPSTTRC